MRKHRTKIGAPLAFIKEAAGLDTNDCIEWPFCTNSAGYGRLKSGGRLVLASHLSLHFSGRPRPSARHLALHAPLVCHNPLCINPSHLRWGTHRDNMADMIADKTAPSGESGSASKLTWEQVSQIRNSTKSKASLAREYGVHPTTIGAVIRGDTWKTGNGKGDKE